jgi:hypothetical protein
MMAGSDSSIGLRTMAFDHAQPMKPTIAAWLFAAAGVRRLLKKLRKTSRR